MSKNSQSTGIENAAFGLLVIGAVVAAVVVIAMVALWVLGVALFAACLYVLPLTLPGYVVGSLMALMSRAAYAETGNELEPKLNAVSPTVVYAIVIGLFVLMVGLPEVHRVRFDEKTSTNWAEIQWPALVDNIAAVKNALKIGQDKKREFRVSELNERGDYFVPKPKAKKGKDAPKTKSQKLADAYGPQTPPGWVPPLDRVAPAMQILEIKLTGPGDEDGIPYDASLLKLLISLSLFIGAPGVFIYAMYRSAAVERERISKERKAFFGDEKSKRDALVSAIEDEKYASKLALAKKDEEIKTLKDRIAEMAKLHLELTETLIPGLAAAAGPSKSDATDAKAQEDSAPTKPKGALGSDFL